MREHTIRPRFERERLERWAAAGDRVAAYMLAHSCGFANALDALHGALPRPSVVLDIRDYQPHPDDPEDP
jgi:hypothetical protein